jgi:hypothetical protein
MEGMAIMVLTIPIVYPMVLELGFDPNNRRGSDPGQH